MTKNVPFTAPVINYIREEAVSEFQEEQETLLMAHLQIAHVYITRAARRRLRSTSVYIPTCVREEMIGRLEQAGFEVSPFDRVPCRYIVRWDF